MPQALAVRCVGDIFQFHDGSIGSAQLAVHTGLGVVLSKSVYPDPGLWSGRMTKVRCRHPNPAGIGVPE